LCTISPTYLRRWQMVRKHPMRGMALKTALMEAGITQKQLAARIGASYSSFNMKLLGERHFTASERQMISEILGKPEEKLFPSGIDNGNEENTQVCLCGSGG
ncbi:MAG: helix-turn-helix transcriptional regulator, partial [Syntrophobacteraceae bacterium]